MVINRGTLIVGIGLLGASLLMSQYGLRKEMTPIEQAGCETYQGNREGDIGEDFFVFDPQTPEERGNRNPDYTLLGNPAWGSQLKIGKQYTLQYEKFSESRSPTPTKEPVKGRLISFSSEGCSSGLEQEVQNPGH